MSQCNKQPSLPKTPAPTGPSAILPIIDSSAILSFALSARDLPRRDRGCVGKTVQDPYIKWSWKENSTKDGVWIVGPSTKHRVNESNPDWTDSHFSYPWTQGTGQMWRFEVMDFDPLNRDDVIGTVEVRVDDYVAKGQQFNGKLDGSEQGTLSVKKVDTVRFKLAAKDLIKLDAFKGLSDPYVKCFWSVGSGAGTEQTLFAKTITIKNVENCEWDEIIEFPIYQPGTNQYWVFKMYDKDPLPKDDSIGEAVILVDEFVYSKGIFLVSLSDKKGNESKLVITPIVNQ